MWVSRPIQTMDLGLYYKTHKIFMIYLPHKKANKVSFSTEKNNEELWKSEVENRISAFDAGLLKSNPIEDVIKRLSHR